MQRSLCLFGLLALLALSTASASTAPSALLPFNVPLAPNPPTSRIHPLLSDPPLVARLNTSSAADIVPGALNYFNISRPEGDRIFALYVPSTYDPKNRTGLPLVFFFHGYSGNWQQGVYFNISAVAERMGYLLALPQGSLSVQNQPGWNAGSCCLFNETTVVDDVAFTRAAVRAVEAVILVDARRRYSMGWSNGAMFSERLACEVPDLFAGVAADEGSVVLSQTGVEDSLALCDTAFGDTQRINYLHFHGTADGTVSWTGTAAFPYFAATLKDVSRWATRDGCGPRVRSTFNDGTFSNIVWPDCRDGREVELMSVRNGVHQWWTMDQGGFETAQYALEWFDRTHGKQVAADEERARRERLVRVLRQAEA